MLQFSSLLLISLFLSFFLPLFTQKIVGLEARGYAQLARRRLEGPKYHHIRWLDAGGADLAYEWLLFAGYIIYGEG